MKRGATGRIEEAPIGGEIVGAFVPTPLPPTPPIEITGSLQIQLEKALLALGRLDSLSTLLPDTELFLYTYVRKEAVLSSQIEGTRSSLSDLLLFEMDEAVGVPINDVAEVSSYVAAMNLGLARLREGLPLCNRLLREVHGVLLGTGRGSDKDPGEFRRSQNWIGGTRPGNASFVPPPPHLVPECMDAFEAFLNSDEPPVPILLKAALAHVQFETIHPFLDGNGRVGRLLIALYLTEAGVLAQPMLYLSLYLKQNRREYYALLDRVRRDGDWEAWLEFFLIGVRETAEAAVQTAQRLVRLFEDDRARIQSRGRSAGSFLRVLQSMTERPVTSIQEICDRTGLSFPTASSTMNALVELGISRELTGRRRNRVFAYDRYIEVLSEGTEPL